MGKLEIHLDEWHIKRKFNTFPGNVNSVCMALKENSFFLSFFFQVIKRTASESSVNIRQLHSIMYPIEQFAANLQDDIEFYPNDGENVYYRLNPALAAGTSYFNSGFYRPGKCIGIKDTQGGKLYSIKDSRDGTVHQVNRYQIKQA